MTLFNLPYTNALLGGILIGCSVIFMMFTIGRITGISGIFSSLLKPKSTMPWQVSFILGMFITALLVHYLYQPITIEINQRLPILIIGGLLVGFGTRLGNGCTSGHGVCGMSRLSIRSIISTLTFIAVGMATVFLLRLTIGI